MAIMVPHPPGATPDPTLDDVPLFEGYEPPLPPDPEPPLSADRRRTKRQADDIAAGRHPLTRGPLHELASRHRDASSPKSDPFTCGSCYFREVLDYHNHSYPKCMVPGPQRVYRKGSDGNWRWETVEGAPRATHSAASDVRAWWPACTDYVPGDRLSDDAARYIPEVGA
jgi:hypothetical protein